MSVVDPMSERAAQARAQLRSWPATEADRFDTMRDRLKELAERIRQARARAAGK